MVPGEHIDFVRKLLDDAGVPRLPEADEKEIRDRLLKETAFTVTGKPCRTLGNRFSEAWDAPGAPTVLPAPLQMLLWWGEGRTRVERANSKEFLTYPVGQLVGDMNAETSVRQVVQGMLNELDETKSRLDQVLE